MLQMSKMQGRVVRKGNSGRRVGKIHECIFHPDENRVIGFLLKRRDILGMIKRDDEFLAFDSFEDTIDFLFVDTDLHKEAFGKAALKRLKLDLDLCLIWRSLPVITQSGKDLGRVNDVFFDDKTGAIIGIAAFEGKTTAAISGVRPIPKNMILGVKDVRLVVSDESEEIEIVGSLADKAAFVAVKTQEKASKAKQKVAQKAPEVAKKADNAVQKGAYKLGKQIGKTKGMFSAFKEEYEKERHER